MNCGNGNVIVSPLNVHPFRLYQLEFDLVEVQTRMHHTKYWLNLNRNRFNDNRDAKGGNKKRK